MRSRSNRGLWTFLAMAWILSACGLGAGAPSSVPVAPAVPATTAASRPAAAADPEAPVAATPTARSGQQATDPTTVNLAAGRPTLVKFFAFW